jgi:hypothetical protein
VNDDKVLDPKEPRLSELQEEFARCSPALAHWNRLTDNERIRFNIWDGQTPDCKRRGTEQAPAKPWEGASDQRVFLADGIINDEVALCVQAFWRGLVQAQAVGIEDAGGAALATRVLNWYMRGPQDAELRREVELSAQYARTYGWCVLHPTWQREAGLRPVDLSMAQVQELAGEEAALLIADPTREEEAVVLLQQVYAAWAASQLAEVIDETPTLSRSEARRARNELASEGTTTLHVPYLTRNEPSVVALRPWVDVFIPDDIGDLQRGRVYVRWFYREEELRAKIASDGWDEEWVKRAVATKGHMSVWSERIDGVETTPGAWSTKVSEEANWIEVVTAYTRRIGKDLVPCACVTVFSPHFTRDDKDNDLVASHGILDFAHGRMPFVPVVREWVARSLGASRGVPELAWPWQRQAKVQADSLIDRTSLTTLPPRLVPPRILQELEDVEFGPASTIPTLRGEEPRFMDVPPNDGVAEKILRLTKEEADSYFGRLAPDVPPARTQLRQQHLVDGFLASWTQAIAQEWQLIQQYCTPKEWERITGEPKPEWQPAEIGRGYDLILSMDVRDLDMDYTLKKLEAVSKFVLPEDAAGIIDRTALVRLKLMAIDPRLAKELVVSDASASQKLFEQVNMELASIYLGNPPRLVENDPTAAQQLAFAQQIVASNPNYQAAMAQPGRFQEAIQTWAANRTQSVTQEQNKLVGRLGVQPMEQKTT